MNRYRFTIAQLVALVFYVGFGFAALRNADPFWASATFTLAIASIAHAVVGAATLRGQARVPWIGYAAFGWTCLLVSYLPKWETAGMGFGPIWRPPLLMGWVTAQLQPYIKPTPPGMGGGSAGDFLQTYEQVSQGLGIILFGLTGAILGRLFPTADDRHPVSESVGKTAQSN
jgi:hypothetical protein